VTDDTAKRILVVDDASLVRRYYRSALETAGFEVAEALNGLEALELLLGDRFDLVIVDVNMPQMDGVSFLQTLRAKSLPLSSIPVLMVSTEAAPQRIATASACRGRQLLHRQAAPRRVARAVRIVVMRCSKWMSCSRSF